MLSNKVMGQKHRHRGQKKATPPTLPTRQLREELQASWQSSTARSGAAKGAVKAIGRPLVHAESIGRTQELLRDRGLRLLVPFVVHASANLLREGGVLDSSNFLAELKTNMGEDSPAFANLSCTTPKDNKLGWHKKTNNYLLVGLLNDASGTLRHEREVIALGINNKTEVQGDSCELPLAVCKATPLNLNILSSIIREINHGDFLEMEEVTLGPLSERPPHPASTSSND